MSYEFDESNLSAASDAELNAIARCLSECLLEFLIPYRDVCDMDDVYDTNYCPSCGLDRRRVTITPEEFVTDN